MSYEHQKSYSTRPSGFTTKYKSTIPTPHSPFDDFAIPKQEATRKKDISAKTIKDIWLLLYKNIKKGHKDTCLFEIAKDCFILSFGLIGMNSADKKKQVFIDELPWLDTPKSDFLSALEYFWNCRE